MRGDEMSEERGVQRSVGRDQADARLATQIECDEFKK